MPKAKAAHTKNLMVKRSQTREVLKGAFLLVVLIMMISMMFAVGLGTSDFEIASDFFTCYQNLEGGISCSLG